MVWRVLDRLRLPVRQRGQAGVQSRRNLPRRRGMGTRQGWAGLGPRGLRVTTAGRRAGLRPAPTPRLAAPPGAGGAEGRARTKDGVSGNCPARGARGTGGSGAPEIGEEGLGEGER